MRKNAILKRILAGRGNPRLKELVNISVALGKAPMLIYLDLDATAKMMAEGKSDLDVLQHYINTERVKRDIARDAFLAEQNSNINAIPNGK